MAKPYYDYDYDTFESDQSFGIGWEVFNARTGQIVDQGVASCKADAIDTAFAVIADLKRNPVKES